MSNRPSRHRSRTVPTVSEPGNSRNVGWILTVVGLVVVGLAVVALVLSAGSSSADFETGNPQIEGTALPALSDPTADQAVGMPAPTVQGENLEGEPISIEADGTPKVVTFMAHWCSHCQAEVPVVQDWIDENGLPDDVDVISVLSKFQPGVQEWPPDQWLEDEGWTVPVLVDDDQGSVSNAYGLAGTPFWVVLDGEGNVVARRSGEIGAEGFATLIETARQAGEGATSETTAAGGAG